MSVKEKAKLLTQDYLFSQLKLLFPNESIHVNVRKDHSFKYTTTGAYLELDVWIPNYNLGFEFQDPYHYVTTWYSQQPQHSIKGNDAIKKQMVLQNGISLVSIPCWWDGSEESLGATISFERPDIVFDSKICPVSLNPPEGYFASGDIPEIGELMVASFPPGNSLDYSTIINWWMGEKYDGVRLCWNYIRQQVYTRTGVPIYLPSAFTKQMPAKLNLDGEFWFGRGEFYITCMVVNSAPEFIHWHLLRMILFDVPSPNLHSLPFEERYELLVHSVHRHHPFVTIAHRVRMKDKDKRKQIKKWVDGILGDNGEGIVLRENSSPYAGGRSSHLIKLKTAQADTEGMVVGINSDGSVQLAIYNGNTFVVPAKEIYTMHPQIGQIVSFSYERRTQSDLPINPKIVRLRHDLLWKDVVRNSHKEKRFLNEYSSIHPIKDQIAKRMRDYFISFAKARDMDPLLSTTWYNLGYGAIHQFQSGKFVLQKFGGSYYKTLHHLFPEIEFDKSLFPEVEKRRQFFQNYASANFFDFQNPENWYKQSRKKLLSFEGAHRVLQAHGNSLIRALCDLFPSISFDTSKFYVSPIWKKERNRKKFFEEYARENSFDPNVAENWYSQSRKKILEKKGADRVLSYHNQSVVTALTDLFPLLTFDKSRFPNTHQWSDPSNRRYFFENFAKQNNFDPLIPDNWYLQSKQTIEAQPGARRVIFYHNFSVAKALLDLFPNIGLDNSKFPKPFMWYSISSTRKYLENFAERHSFDPRNPENWYSRFNTLVAEKQASGAIFFNDVSTSKAMLRTNVSLKDPFGAVYYNNMSVSKALLEIYPDIGLDKLKFPKPAQWFNIQKTRNFFEEYAKQKNFDPLNPNNWYLNNKDISTIQKNSNIVFYGNQNTIQALMDIYPDIGLEKSKFPKSTLWYNQVETKKFFDSYANENKFNALVPANWYEHYNNLVAIKKTARIIFFHNHSIPKALMDVYPKIGLLESNFNTPPMWYEKSNRRKFFEEYAQEHNFDPLNAEAWYLQPRKKILEKKSAIPVLRYHNMSVAEALMDLFPEIGLDNSRFTKPPLWYLTKKKQILM